MSETPPYFYNPFAVGGDVATVPVTTQPSGSVSYEQGWGPDYEKNLLTDPTAKPMGRTTTNQVLFDITTLLQQYSQYGVPPFITNAQNQGVDFPYPIYARTRYSGVIYENQVEGNTALPGTDDTWLVISGDSTGVLPGVMLDYAGATVPAGYLWCDGSAISRATYGTLLSLITQTQTGTTTNTLDTVSGLTDTSKMYVGMPLESANFPGGTTVATIVDANNITASAVATASGAISIQFFNWGNGDGSTTFNVPDSRRSVSMGSGGTASTDPLGIGNIVGQYGGEESHVQTTGELAAHVHADDPASLYGNGGTGQFTAGGDGGPDSRNSGSTGSSTPFNIIQSAYIATKIIKT